MFNLNHENYRILIHFHVDKLVGALNSIAGENTELNAPLISDNLTTMLNELDKVKELINGYKEQYPGSDTTSVAVEGEVV